MTYDEIQKRFSGFPFIPANKFGLTRVTIASNVKDEIHIDEGYKLAEGYGLVEASLYPEFSEIKKIDLAIVDGKVASIKVIYPNDVKWTSEDEFKKKVKESLKIDESSLDGCDISIRIRIMSDYDKASSQIIYPPYIEVDDFLLSMKPKGREYEEKKKEKENANFEDQRRRDEFKP